MRTLYALIIVDFMWRWIRMRCMSQGEGDEYLVPLWGKRSLHRLPFIVLADLFRSRHLLKLLVKRCLLYTSDAADE